MTVGIPRAFLYYRYNVLWQTFFDALNIEYVVSQESDKEIMRRGVMFAIDEACLSSKVYLGHVDALIGRCDAVFVPRVASFAQREILCTKFGALYDIVQNTFRDKGIQLLDYNIDVRRGSGEMQAFLDLGKKLGRKKPQVLYAYMMAKQAERQENMNEVNKQERLLEKEGSKILIVGHGYNAHDKMIGRPVSDYLSALGAIPIYADICDRRRALERSFELTETLPWVYNRELCGAVMEYRERVDGIILLSAFPCGPDSLVNEIILRRVKEKPVLNLLIDNQEGSAGLETRLESFIDLIHYRKVGGYARV